MSVKMVGKPNQTIPSAPLHTIPVWESLLSVDFGLRWAASKNPNQGTICSNSDVCAATRFPEAVPLRTLKAQAIVKENS